MFLSQTILHITISPFCISQNTNRSNRRRHKLHACKAVASYKIEPTSRMSANHNPLNIITSKFPIFMSYLGNYKKWKNANLFFNIPTILLVHLLSWPTQLLLPKHKTLFNLVEVTKNPHISKSIRNSEEQFWILSFN